MEQLDSIEKIIWTEADFEMMNWHDVHIHALAFLPDDFEIAFDIDYIFEWINPEPNETYFKFRIVPATLVFKNVYDIEFDIGSFNGGLEIDSVGREDKRTPHNAQFIGRETEWLWIIECQEGEIKFRSVGYELYFRTEPQLGTAQTLDLKARGFSFTRGRGI